MRVTAIISCQPTPLTEAQHNAIAARGIEFIVINRRLGRLLIDMNLDSADRDWVVGRLVAANLTPRLLAAFRFDTGRRLHGVVTNSAEILSLAPDDIDPVTGVATRPTVLRQWHQWAGWAFHNELEEP